MVVHRNGKHDFLIHPETPTDCFVSFRIRHFDRKRTFEQFKKRMEKGFDPLSKEEQQKYEKN
jgi:hypothetical protein